MKWGYLRKESHIFPLVRNLTFIHFYFLDWLMEFHKPHPIFLKLLMIIFVHGIKVYLTFIYCHILIGLSISSLVFHWMANKKALISLADQ